MSTEGERRARTEIKPLRVALFGGSFNPPHVAHQLVGLYVLETQPVDEIWFLPVYEHVFGKQLAPYTDRIEMCRLIADSLGPRAKVNLGERLLAQEPDFEGSRTYDLLRLLQRLTPHAEFRWVIGSDILAETHKWYRWDDVVALAPLIVIGRGGHLPPGSTATGVTMPTISSTTIREGLAAKSSLDGLLPTSVLRYIAEHELYRS